MDRTRGSGSTGYRMNARGAIEEAARRVRHRGDGLEALLRALPEDLDPKADEILWEIVCYWMSRI